MKFFFVFFKLLLRRDFLQFCEKDYYITYTHAQFNLSLVNLPSSVTKLTFFGQMLLCSMPCALAEQLKLCLL